ncbi:MAG: TldD/PmbA family protein [Candidatus Andeanibacterium colombiense]|uniref:TldD/PmbA family protein n=1 Tax=Candidatus Andeanibacterium colombiense TaxID=3121345 RepID=A0AAJ5X427_9SPHN|nr:MAG: TldD/PmbA family protein [Sphingomonadaceae bacterium]
MLSIKDAEARCAAAIDLALKAGADAADAVAIGSSSEEVQVRLGKLEDVGRSESEDISLRVFCGQRSASIHATDMSDAALAELAERAVAMARAAPEDQYAGLAPAELLAQGPFPDLDLEAAEETSPATLRRLAEECEDAARAVQGVTNSEGGGASFGRSSVALVTSHGFSGAYAATSIGLSASVIAGEGGGMQRDYDYRTARHAEDLLSPQEIGRSAGERAVRRLDPGRMQSKPMSVVFDPRVGNSLLGHLLGGISGAAIARKASFLLGREDEELFPAGIRIVEDPLRPRGLRSRPFDGEGLPTAARAWVEHGRITGWMTNAAAARQLGIGLTGHASRGGGGAPGISASNLHLEAGSVSVAELIADIEEGVFVNELIGQGVNGVTGDYSRGASGFRIVKGEIAGPVAEFTVAGNLVDMFKAMSVADDLEFQRSMDVPTIRIEGMTVAGD